MFITPNLLLKAIRIRSLIVVQILAVVLWIALPADPLVVLGAITARSALLGAEAARVRTVILAGGATVVIILVGATPGSWALVGLDAPIGP